MQKTNRIKDLTFRNAKEMCMGRVRLAWDFRNEGLDDWGEGNAISFSKCSCGYPEITVQFAPIDMYNPYLHQVSRPVCMKQLYYPLPEDEE